MRRNVRVRRSGTLTPAGVWVPSVYATGAAGEIVRVGNVRRAASGVGATGGAGLASVSGAAGENETRILSLLAGRTPHFSYTPPYDPEITREVTVSTATNFNNAALVAGTRIIVNTSFSGDVRIRANDIDVVMSNAATITGNLSIGTNTSAANRFRWTGGNVNGRTTIIRANDVVFDDYYTYVAGTSSNAPHDFTAGWSGTGHWPWDRVAILNSTFQVVPPNNTDNWAFYTGQLTGGTNSTNLILGNVKFLSPGQTYRINNVTNVLVFDSAFNPNNGGASSGGRFHHLCTNVWFADSYWVSFFKLDASNTTDTDAAVLNAVFERNAHYDDFINAFAIQVGSGINTPNQGIVRNHTIHWAGGAGAFPSVSPLTDGGGNTRVAWDGVTLPDHSAIGAVR